MTHDSADVPDYGHQVGFQVLRRGTPIMSADGVQIGTVRRISNAVRERIFDGITIDTPEGQRFLDAPEVDTIYERAVVTTFVAADAATHLQVQQSRLAAVVNQQPIVRRMKRLPDQAKERWDRR